MKEFLNSKLHTPLWLFVLLFFVLILRIPSFFEPYYYGDEMIYLTLGEGARQGVTLYKDLHDNKPPFLYLTAAIAGSLFWFKAILAIWHILTVFVFWKLSVVLFPKKELLQKVSTVIFAIITTLPLLEGNIANAELFMVGPMMLAFYILLSKKLTPVNLLAAGFLFSVSTLFKVPAVFDIPAIFFLWIVSTKINKNSLKEIAKNSFYIAAGLLAPILLIFAWYWLQGAFTDYLIAAYLQNVGYLSSFRPGDVQKPFLEKNAPLLFRAFATFVGLLILYIQKKKLSKQFVFITAWLLLTLFAVTLPERPYPHYLIQSAAPISFLLAILFTQKTMEQIYAIVPLTIAFIVPVYFNFWYYPTTSYYARFVKFAMGDITRRDYASMFDANVPRNYRIARYVAAETTPDDKIFVWGSSSTIYALSRRLPPVKYVADYHVHDFSTKEKVLEELNYNLPEVIVVLPEGESFPELNTFLLQNYASVNEIEGAEVWRLLSPGVRSLISKVN